MNILYSKKMAKFLIFNIKVVVLTFLYLNVIHSLVIFNTFHLYKFSLQ